MDLVEVIREIVIRLPVIVFSVIIHEIAHGWVALKCGDPTARDAGRLTLNPIPHISPFMSIVLPIILIVQGFFSGSFFIFGGAKPIPINPNLLRRGERDQVKISFAGPGSNLLLALAAFLSSVVLVMLYRATGMTVIISLLGILNLFIQFNLILANFNLLPIPPLDGSWILSYFLKGEAKRSYLRLQMAGFRVFFLFLFILMIFPGLFKLIFMPSIMVLGLFNHLLRALLH